MSIPVNPRNSKFYVKREEKKNSLEFSKSWKIAEKSSLNSLLSIKITSLHGEI